MSPETRVTSDPGVEAEASRLVADVGSIRAEVKRLLVGQERALEELLAVLLAGGHALVEGVPGTGKTLLVRSLARVAGLDFRRVQFTPDLLPADILGCETLVPADGSESRVEFRPGPVFTQFLLADEINRGTPRTQSALLEAMQERGVTIGGEGRPLDPLFSVFATRNPIEMEGTYPLPEAQLDRFLLEIRIPAPTAEEMVAIAERTTGEDPPEPQAVITAERLLEMRETTRKVIAAPAVVGRGARILRATQPESDSAPSIVRECVRHGAGVRALQALVLTGKVAALEAGRIHLAHSDLDAHLVPALRHRLILSIEGEARGVLTEEIVAEVMRVAGKAGS